MSLLESAQYLEVVKTVSGTILFGDVALSDFSNLTFVSGDDYNVFVEGDGFVVTASKSELGFDYTVGSGTIRIRIYPKKLGAIAPVS